MTEFVKAAALSKVYFTGGDPIYALQDINLSVGRGNFVSIVGPSGCGKSTLLKCIAGLESISGGDLLVQGESVVKPPTGMGVVFQRDLLLDWRTVLDNVLLSVEFLGLRRQEYKERAIDVLSLFGLKDFVNRYPWELSGGMRQRVAICRALIIDPELLLMDEPFGALDAMTRDELNWELQRTWMATKKTVIFITHSIAEAVYLGDQVIVMSRNPGRIAEKLEIALARPRELSIRETPHFGEYVGYIRNIFTKLGTFQH